MYMRCIVGMVLLLSLSLSATGTSAGQSRRVVRHQISAGQARQIARLVAHHDHIDLSDTHIEFNSMDLSSAFIPGYSSFIVIRESTTPGPDETLHRYAINRRTGDAWEMTLCTHYDFPALSQMRREFAGSSMTAPAELAAQSKQLGCSKEQGAATL